MAIIPADKERAAVAMFRAVAADPNDIAMARIHAHIWPPRPPGAGGPVGGAPLSVPMLRTLLASISASTAVEEPGDDLPDDLEAAVDDLKESRAMVMVALRSGAGSAGAGGTSEGGTDADSGGAAAAMLHQVLVRNVKALVDVSKHRIEVQEWRERRAAAARARGARGTGGR